MDNDEAVGDQRNGARPQQSPAFDLPLTPNNEPLKNDATQPTIPLREGDDVDLQSERTNLKISNASKIRTREKTNVQPPRRTTTTSSDTGKEGKQPCFLRTAAVIVIVLSNICFVIIVVAALHLSRTVNFIDSLTPGQCT
ncbi:hypothetical protein RB195_017313 [Necator americanus]|uniref:Uncharacterized protein n=1 Tax=Necator americanus TaxID=51031 RepID=A0ABR1C7S2_NECAM